MKIKKVLIANRGEIACRIIKTLKKLGISSVAIYSEADSKSLHVTMADERFFVGPSPSNQSYLNIDAICNAALECKADAVHPGFGFLSENATFAKRLEELGIKFIGPNHEVIGLMGDKIQAKKIAIDAGVNIIKGYMGEINNADEVMQKVEEIGFPLIIKAAAGGGGKGMRIVKSADEIDEALSLAQSEAKKSFGDNRVFIEQYIEKPRHIEIQILADKFGNVVCLGERECSIQRRYQKVIEEAPSCFMTNTVRQQMYKQSIKLAKQVNYYSVGTIEFIMDQNKNFYFLEMNTRIQVEHPVTELITGIDLIDEMIKVEEGHKLTIKQDQVTLNGHAIEARIYAEDPTNNFLPVTGTIINYTEPNGKNIRIDTGVEIGSEITMFYDPMIEKLCAYGKNREDAIKNINLALQKLHITGFQNNIAFLQSILSNPEFISGNLHTDFIQDFYPNGFESDNLTSKAITMLSLASLYLHLNNEQRNNAIFDNNDLSEEWTVKVQNQTQQLIVKKYTDGYMESSINGNTGVFTLTTNWTPGNIIFICNIDNHETIFKLNKMETNYILQYQTTTALCRVYRSDYSHLLKFTESNNQNEEETSILAPITGMITKIYVKKGDEVTAGQALFIIEAMKMENTFYAKVNAKVIKVNYSEGEQVNTNDVIIEY